MAEGWARHLKGDIIDAWSAGIEQHWLNPLAGKALPEAAVLRDCDCHPKIKN